MLQVTICIIFLLGAILAFGASLIGIVKLMKDDDVPFGIFLLGLWFISLAWFASQFVS